MIQRIRQFIRAMTAQIRPADRLWINQSIPAAARPLFYAMHPADQYHALHVARTAMQLWDELPETEQSKSEKGRAFLLRCALLHDTGRVRGDMDIWGKVFCVLMAKLAPEYSRQAAERGKKKQSSAISHALYVYFHHAEIGAAKLCTAGLAAEAAIIVRHHQPVKAEDPLILKLLREADERN